MDRLLLRRIVHSRNLCSPVPFAGRREVAGFRRRGNAAQFDARRQDFIFRKFRRPDHDGALHRQRRFFHRRQAAPLVGPPPGSPHRRSEFRHLSRRQNRGGPGPLHPPRRPPGNRKSHLPTQLRRRTPAPYRQREPLGAAGAPLNLRVAHPSRFFAKGGILIVILRSACRDEGPHPSSRTSIYTTKPRPKHSPRRRLLGEILRCAQNDGREAPPFQNREGWATRKTFYVARDGTAIYTRGAVSGSEGWGFSPAV